MGMFIDGDVNIEGKCSQAVLTLSGMVTYNTQKLKKSIHALNHSHYKRERKTPITMYVGLKLYSAVRSKAIVDHLFHLGISILYDRVLSITKSLYEGLTQKLCSTQNLLTKQFEERVLCCFSQKQHRQKCFIKPCQISLSWN